MTKEDEDLLIKDLCTRLPYGVKISVQSWDEEEQEYIDKVDVLYSVNRDGYIKSSNEDYDFSIENIKPYLFPLSSMTDEQYDEMEKLVSEDYLENIQVMKEMREKVEFITHWPLYSPKVIDWFHKKHIDYLGLISMGLAIDATDKNIY